MKGPIASAPRGHVPPQEQIVFGGDTTLANILKRVGCGVGHLRGNKPACHPFHGASSDVLYDCLVSPRLHGATGTAPELKSEVLLVVNPIRRLFFIIEQVCFRVLPPFTVCH